MIIAGVLIMVCSTLFGGPAASADHGVVTTVLVRWVDEALRGPETREFYRFLQEAAMRKHRDLFRYREPIQFDIGTFDLNDDGVNEIFVLPHGLGWCGTDPHCSVNVYHKDQGTWRFVGNVDALAWDVTSYAVTLSEERFNGWRVIEGLAVRHCWVDNPGSDYGYRYMREDFIGLSPELQDVGYMHDVSLGHPCTQP